jgi:BirA family biotin operon repressor/biotin-[acetyl-CoA-carboxylase] ligase
MYKELSFPGYSCARLYDEVTSTMDVARELLGELRGGHGVVCARVQTAGRGRQGRSWVSQHDALMVTFLFSSTAPLHACAGYSLGVGVTVAQAFDDIGAQVLLKWPNDIVTVKNDALLKVGGILTEVQDLGASRVLLVGIGINLVSAPGAVERVSSIQELSGVALSPEQALERLSVSLLGGHTRFVSSGGFLGFKDEWESRSCFENGRTVIALDRGYRTIEGVFVGVDECGALVLDVAGERVMCHSGHTVSLRHLRDGTKPRL